MLSDGACRERRMWPQPLLAKVMITAKENNTGANVSFFNMQKANMTKKARKAAAATEE